MSVLVTEDCLFPCNNDLEIPNLRLDLQPRVCSVPFLCFGEQKRTHNMKGVGTLHFYTDDYRFNTVYEHPEKILRHNPANIVEPNFSLYNDTPIAFGMQAVYKKRMVSRLMQENGIRVFVDLNVAPKFYKLNLLGVPKGYSAFCTRGYSDRLNLLEFELEMAKFVADGNDMTFVVYGGGEEVKKFCRDNGLVYVTPVIAIKNKLKSFEKMKEVVAFMDTDISMKNQLLEAKELFDRQVESFKEEKLLLQ